MKPIALAAFGIVFASGLAAWGRETATARLVWVNGPPPECIDGQAIERATEAQLGRPVFSGLDGGLEVWARYGEDPPARMVALEIRSRSGRLLGERQLSSATGSCEELGSLLPVVIAVLLDLENAEEEPPARARTSPSSDEPTPAVGSAVLDSPAVDPDEARRGASRTRAQLAILAETIAGVQPGLGFGTGIGGSIFVLDSLAADVWGDFRAPSSTSGVPTLTLRSYSAGGGLCVQSVSSELVAASVCAGGGATWFDASGSNFVRNGADDRRVAPEARLLGRVDLRFLKPFFARFELGLLVPLERLKYGYTTESGARVEVHEPGPSALIRAGLGTSFR
jgi:hypothetical protein